MNKDCITNTKLPVCPYCLTEKWNVRAMLTECSPFMDDTIQTICLSCDKVYNIERMFIMVYTTSPVKTLVCDDFELVDRALRNLRPRPGEYPRWASVTQGFGLGSTAAKELCVKHGLDPEEMLRSPKHYDHTSDAKALHDAIYSGIGDIGNE